jgi:phage/plasmid primase-like uncharacterized protein
MDALMAMATKLIDIGDIDIEAIKDQHPLASVVEPYVALKKKGTKLEGLCPFHVERSPSFKIFEKDDRFHCFGCGAHGDAFDFLRMQEGLDLRAAAERLTGGVYPTYSADRIEEIRLKRLRLEQEDQAKRETAIAFARETWMAANHDVVAHPYLDRKQIGPNGARLDGDRLLIPLMGDDGKVQSLQAIASDGRKLFVTAAPVTGGLMVIGGKVATSTDLILLCEGFATGASLHEATGLVVVCAFNSGNMSHVATRLAQKYPDKHYVVAGDDDRGKDKNVGRAAAIDAAQVLHCQAVFPDFAAGSTGTDFNDMACELGKEAVRALVVDGELPSGEPVPETPQLIRATPFKWREEAAIPPRKWLYGRHLLRKFLSVDIAAGGVGKSSVKIGEALSMAANRALYGKDVHEGPLRVWIYNLEDPSEETERRVHATAKRFGLTSGDFGDRLYVDSGRDQPCVIASETKDGVKIMAPIVDAIVAEIKARGVDVLTIDPFVSSHEVSENDNKAIDIVAKEWARIADICNCSINLVHHIRKLNGAEATAESARGAISLIAAARSVLVYNRMSKEEAESAGLPPEEASFIFRTTNDKANLSPPEKADWYRMVNVNLNNGDQVGVACPWQWPDPFEGVSIHHLRRAQSAVAEGEWRESSQSPQWVGVAIAPVLNLDLSKQNQKKRLAKIIAEWVKSGALEIVEKADGKRMVKQFVVVGKWVDAT